MKRRSFTAARKFVHSLKLKNQKEWKEYCKSGKKPEDIPSNPWRTYKKEWKSMMDWQGRTKKWRSFTESRKFVHSLKLKNQYEWQEYSKSAKRPIDIPGGPNVIYKKKWRGWGDWLGTGVIGSRKKGKQQWSFKKARKFIHLLKLKGKDDWYEYCKSGKKPSKIPGNPSAGYKGKGWKDWGDFLGTGYIAHKNRIYLPPIEARIAIKKIAKEVFGGKPFTERDWIKAHRERKIPKNLPSNLANMYDPDYRLLQKDLRRKRNDKRRK